MKNEDLTGLGLTEEQAAAVVALHDGELERARLAAAVDSALVAARVRDVRAARPFIDMEKLSLSGDSVKGLAEQLRALRESQGYLFEERQRPKTGLRHGGEPRPDRREQANAALRGALGKRGY